MNGMGLKAVPRRYGRARITRAAGPSSCSAWRACTSGRTSSSRPSTTRRRGSMVHIARADGRRRTLGLTRLGVLGWPVAHSRSPAMQNAALRAAGLDGWRYQLLPVPPEAFAETVRRCRHGFRRSERDDPAQGGRAGARRQATAAARAIGAANTLTFRMARSRPTTPTRPGCVARWANRRRGPRSCSVRGARRGPPPTRSARPAPPCASGTARPSARRALAPTSARACADARRRPRCSSTAPRSACADRDDVQGLPLKADPRRVRVRGRLRLPGRRHRARGGRARRGCASSTASRSSSRRARSASSAGPAGRRPSTSCGRPRARPGGAR